MNDDLISRDAVLDACSQSINILDAMSRIEDLPSVTPKQRTGHWIEHPEIETSAPEYLMFYECSECGDKQCFCKSDIHRKHFCNNCGAKMVDPQESDHKCHTCKHYTSGENDGSCGSYICKGFSNWESEDKE